MEQLLANLNNVVDPSMPGWAGLLIQGMHVIVTEFKTIKDLTQRVVNLESEKIKSDEVVDNLRIEVNQLRVELDVLKLDLDDQEQRNRNQCLMIHGIAESEREKTDELVMKVFNEDLRLAVPLEHIQRSHRVGPKERGNDRRTTRSTPPRPRPIIIRFRDFRTRSNVFFNKRHLKGTGISVTENLTKFRMDLLRLANAKYGNGNVWTIEGRITTKINNKYVVIKSPEDLE